MRCSQDCPQDPTRHLAILRFCGPSQAQDAWEGLAGNLQNPNPDGRGTARSQECKMPGKVLRAILRTRTPLGSKIPRDPEGPPGDVFARLPSRPYQASCDLAILRFVSGARCLGGSCWQSSEPEPRRARDRKIARVQDVREGLASNLVNPNPLGSKTPRDPEGPSGEVFARLPAKPSQAACDIVILRS